MTGIHDAVKQMADHPELHTGNRFAHDIVAKYGKFGSVSEKQERALIQSLQRDIDKLTAAPAPSGLATVTGTVLTVKPHQDKRTGSWKDKATVRLPNGSRVWVTVPAGLVILAHDEVTISAVFKHADGDPTFAFGSRASFGATAGDEAFEAPQPAKAAPAPAKSILETLLDTY